MIELSLSLILLMEMFGSKQNSIPPNDSVNEVLLVLSDIAMIKKLQLIDYIIKFTYI